MKARFSRTQGVSTWSPSLCKQAHIEHVRAALVSSWAWITSTKFARPSPQTVHSPSLCGYCTPVNLASVFGARLSTENQVFSPKLPQKYLLPEHICCAGGWDGCWDHPLLLGRTWARAAETQCPWIMNGLSYQERNSYFVMTFPIPTWWEVMQEMQDSRNTSEAAEQGWNTHFSGTVFSTWSLGVIQIIHINFYTGVSPADALSPQCLETICFLEWGQNSQLLLTSLSSKHPWWVIIRCTWVSREEREGCGLSAFVCMDWATANSYIWHLDYFPSFWGFGFPVGSEHFW